jgi:deazaflavin-dependent oxidoreductase (nitroreductase family)
MSVRVPPHGSRGSRFPKFPGPMARFFSRVQQRGFRRKGGGRTGGGIHSLILESVGARTGDKRIAMLGYLEETPASWLIIASLAGTARNPAWLHNLAKQPQATVEFGDGRRVDVLAETLHGPELETAWDRIGRDAPEYVKYRSMTDREIPVVRLRERQGT